MGVIIATIALEANILNSNQYSAAIFATIIVSVIFSFLLRNQQDNILMEQERFGVKI